MLSNLRKSTFILAIIMSPVAFGSDNISDSELIMNETISEKIRIHSDNAVLYSAQIRELEQRKRKLELEAEVMAIETPSVEPASMTSDGANGNEPEDTANIDHSVIPADESAVIVGPNTISRERPMYLYSVFGRPGNLHANIGFSSSEQSVVRVGETFENWKVVSIDVGSINLSRDSEALRLIITP
jgi:hypothetical protein